MEMAVRNLSKSFGGVRALTDVSFDIPPGSIVAVLGANGAGKTTLLQALAGIVAPDAGEIRYDGERFSRDRIDLRRRFFFLPDWPPVIPSVSVIEHISMVLRVYAIDRVGIEDEVVELLREFEILPLIDSPLITLSRGQTYKAALVPLLAVRPELWIIDEPFASGIDPLAIAAVRRHARAATGHGGIVIYTTQILELATRFSDQVCVLDRGSLAGIGNVDRLEQIAMAGSPLRRLLDTLQSDAAPS